VSRYYPTNQDRTSDIGGRKSEDAVERLEAISRPAAAG